MLRSLQTTNPENHDMILKELVDSWIKEMKRRTASSSTSRPSARR